MYKGKRLVQRLLSVILMCALSAGVLLGFVRIWSAWAESTDSTVIALLTDEEYVRMLMPTPVPTPVPTPEPTAVPEPTATPEPVAEVDEYEYVMPEPAQSVEPAAIPRAVIATDDVNVRSGAGTQYSVLGKLFSGDSAWYLEQQSSDSSGNIWYKISFGNQEGWVSSKYVRIADSVSTGSSQTYSGSSVQVVGGSVKIRSGPGLDYSVVGQMAEGRVVPYLGQTSVDSRGVAWYYIDFNGVIGWVSSKYSMII